MVEGQFLEVNWFSKWTNMFDEEELLRKAKRFYGDGEYRNYLQLIEPILVSLITRANGDQKDFEVRTF